jgi:hypothetical protein
MEWFVSQWSANGTPFAAQRRDLRCAKDATVASGGGSGAAAPFEFEWAHRHTALAVRRLQLPTAVCRLRLLMRLLPLLLPLLPPSPAMFAVTNMVIALSDA